VPVPAPALQPNRPSPFELDRAKKAATRPPEPQSSGANALAPEAVADGDWRQRFHAALMELGMPFTADAIENSRIIESGGELQFTTSAAYKLALRPDDLTKALKQISSKAYRISVKVGDAGSPGAPLAVAPAAPAPAAEEDATSRALSDPEVQRFRDVFGGEIRKVRNLKE
jgi:hypothetical protein